ncbi:MAG: nucleotide kinase domain-containing protein [Syntrophobacteraceae bacterium]
MKMRQLTLSSKIARGPKKVCSTAGPMFLFRSPLRVTPVYDAYWRFAAERQQIFFRRLSGMPAPWTDDETLTRYRFTNAYRASDRVRQYLLRKVIYSGDPSPQETIFRILLFKFFNKIETWELFLNAFGEIAWRDFSVRAYDTILQRAKCSGQKIYSGAYIMPSGGPHLKLMHP